MQFGLHLPASSATVKPDDLVRFAQHAEALDFSLLTVADHVIVPTNISVPYPYTVDGKYPGTGYPSGNFDDHGFSRRRDPADSLCHQRDDLALSQSRS